MEYVTETGPRLSGVAAPMAILITDGVGKGDLGLVTTFCSCNQAKMEASEALATLHQCNSPKSSIFMVRRYTNTPFIPQGTSRLLYFNASALPGGASSTQFPLDHLYLWKLLPYSKTKVLLSCEEGRWGLEHTPFPERFYGNAPKSCTTSPMQCHYQCLCQLPLPTWKKVFRWEQKLGYNPALQCLQDFNQTRAQIESELSEDAQKLDHKYNT